MPVNICHCEIHFLVTANFSKLLIFWRVSVCWLFILFSGSYELNFQSCLLKIMSLSSQEENVPSISLWTMLYDCPMSSSTANPQTSIKGFGEFPLKAQCFTGALVQTLATVLNLSCSFIFLMVCKPTGFSFWRSFPPPLARYRTPRALEEAEEKGRRNAASGSSGTSGQSDVRVTKRDKRSGEITEMSVA